MLQQICVFVSNFPSLDLLVCRLKTDLSSFVLKLDVLPALLQPLPRGCTFQILLYTNEYRSAGSDAWKSWVPADHKDLFDIKDPMVCPLILKLMSAAWLADSSISLSEDQRIRDGSFYRTLGNRICPAAAVSFAVFTWAIPLRASKE